MHDWGAAPLGLRLSGVCGCLGRLLGPCGPRRQGAPHAVVIQAIPDEGIAETGGVMTSAGLSG